MSRKLVRILIILLLIYLVAGVLLNLFILGSTIETIRENPMLIIEAPFQYILELVNKKT